MATIASATMVAFQLAGRATRDALYLSTFPVSTLARMIMASSVLAGLVCIVIAQVLARVGPARIVPRLFLLSALLLLVEWGLFGVARPAAAIVLYLHFSALGALLISGFWAMVNERLDPRAARRAIARITLGATVGGLLGGLLPERVGAYLSLGAMFPILAAFHGVSGLLVLGLRPVATPEGAGATADRGPVVSARRAFAGSPYLRGLVVLVVLTVMAEGLLDFVFKIRAAAASTSGEGLLRLFSLFYTATALLSMVVQATLMRPLLARQGIARSASLLPAGASLGALAGLFFPGLLPIVLARGTEVVVRNSLFRGAYELLFTPVSAAEKRATKLLVDVGASRLGDAAGGAVVQSTLWLAAGAAGQWMLVGVIALSSVAVVVARRLHRGYVAALERGLVAGAGRLAAPSGLETGSLVQTVGGFDLTLLRAPGAGAGTEPGAATPESGPEPAPAKGREQGLASKVPAVVRAALLEGPLDAEGTERAIALLAWDEVAPEALRALRAVAPAEGARLVAHLLDPAEDFAIRRRLVSALAECPRPEVFEGLLRALADRRFEVRYRAGRALAHLKGLDPRLAVEPERIYAVVRNEVAVERGVWESRQVLDEVDEGWARVDAEVVRARAGRSMEHVFTLLSLVLPREPVRLAYRGLFTEDARLRGTALEYLESVLPGDVRKGLWPFLEPEAAPRTRAARTPREALDNLLASHDSIVAALAEGRRGD